MVRLPGLNTRASNEIHGGEAPANASWRWLSVPHATAIPTTRLLFPSRLAPVFYFDAFHSLRARGGHAGPSGLAALVPRHTLRRTGVWRRSWDGRQVRKSSVLPTLRTQRRVRAWGGILKYYCAAMISALSFPLPPASPTTFSPSPSPRGTSSLSSCLLPPFSYTCLPF